MNMLTLKGGGVKGIIHAKILDALSMDSDFVRENFDFFAGTSIGGINCIALASGRFSPKDLVNIFINEATSLFSQNPNWFLGLAQDKYTRFGIDHFLREKIGSLKMYELEKPTVVFSYDMINDKYRIWSSIDQKTKNLEAFHAAGATSAAPTYFPKKVTKFNKTTWEDVDGGICMNSHSVPALVHFAEFDISKVLHIGTGIFSNIINNQYFDFIQGGKLKFLLDGMVEKGMAVQEVLDIEYIRTYADKHKMKYVYLDIKLDKVYSKIDESGKDHMVKFAEAINMEISTRLYRKILENVEYCFSVKNSVKECDNANKLMDLYLHKMSATEYVTEIDSFKRVDLQKFNRIILINKFNPYKELYFCKNYNNDDCKKFQKCDDNSYLKILEVEKDSEYLHGQCIQIQDNENLVKIKKEMLQENRKILQDEGLDSSLFCDSWIDDSSQGRDEL